MEATCSSVVERPLTVRLVVGWILHSGPTEQFLVPANVPRLTYPVSGMVHIKETLLLIGNGSHGVAAAGFLCLSRSLPYG